MLQEKQQDFQQKNSRMFSPFPFMKASYSRRVRIEKALFSSMNHKQQQNYSQQLKLRQDIKFLQKMKKARSLILSNYQNNKIMKSTDIKLIKQPLYQEQTQRNYEDKKFSGVVYRCGNKRTKTKLPSLSLSKSTQRQLRVCKSDFRSNKHQYRKGFIFNEIGRYDKFKYSASQKSDNDSQSKKETKNMSQSEQSQKQYKNDHELRLQNINSSCTEPISCKITKRKQKCLPIQHIMLLPIRNKSQEASNPIKKRKKVKKYMKNQQAMSKNLKLGRDLVKQLEISEMKKSQRQKSPVKKIDKEQEEQQITPKRKIMSKFIKKKNIISNKIANNAFLERKQKQDSNYKIEGWMHNSIQNQIID